MIDIIKLLYRLNKIGISLSAIRDLDEFFDYILKEAREFANCDGGTLYTVHGDLLELTVSQNQTLSERAGDNAVKTNYIKVSMPISTQSIAGYVTLTGNTVNIADAYDIDKKYPFKHNKSFDEKSDYKTISILTVPLKEPSGNILGILQLINRRDNQNNITPFPDDLIDLTQSLASQAAVALRNVKYSEELKKSYYETIFRLSVAAEFKDSDTANHLKRMSHYAQMIAKNISLPQEETELILHAAPMHDIGKLGIPDHILLKPGRLTDEEWEEMKKHTVYGSKILENSKNTILETSRVIALYHHEKYNGLGYPFGLKGEDIPLYARICSIADVFDALTSTRPYKKSFSSDESFKIIEDETGLSFDPELAEAFLRDKSEVLSIMNTYRESDQNLK
ncbi:HD domain-containing protein [candidate division WOR-3 bacterium]|nr:HD domain-containing protein [candidate division WOR-3 bacterium]